MKKVLLLCLMFLIFGCTGRVNYPEVVPGIQNIYGASVSILSTQGDERVIGSGTILSKKVGWVLTAAHVVKSHKEENKTVDVLIDKKKIINMYIVKFDEDHDLALLETKSISHHSAVELESKLGKVGQKVWVIGSPLGEKKTVTVGVISNRIRDGKRFYYRTNAELFFGNSGGGMFSEDGKLLGVVSSLQSIRLNPFCIVIEPGGFYAISLEDIRNFLK